MTEEETEEYTGVDWASKKEAAKIARQIGDEEWKRGETKHALEAWEASNITPKELLELANKLLAAAPQIEEFWRRERNARQLVGDSKNSRGCQYAHIWDWTVYSETCNHHTCQARLDLLKNFYEEVCIGLGWTEVKPGRFFNAAGTTFMSLSFYRAAAVACLKLIKRMH